MKTIEQLLQPLIKTDIQYLLNKENTDNHYTLALTNNFNTQSKDNDRYDIQAITQSGQGVLTQLPNTKAVQTPLQLIFQIPVNYQKRFIKILNKYILTTNAVWSEVIDDLEDDELSTEEKYQYRLVWKAPIISGTPFDIQVKSENEELDSESVNMIQVILMGDVTHTSSFAMDDETLYLWSETESNYLKIEGITAENEPLSPTINQTQLVDSYQTKKDVNGDSQVLNLTLAVQTSNLLHKELIELYYNENRNNISFDSKLKRVRKSIVLDKTYDVIISLNRYKQNGFEYLQLTITRK